MFKPFGLIFLNQTDFDKKTLTELRTRTCLAIKQIARSDGLPAEASAQAWLVLPSDRYLFSLFIHQIAKTAIRWTSLLLFQYTLNRYRTLSGFRIEVCYIFA
jgi:hypothetical protein